MKIKKTLIALFVILLFAGFALGSSSSDEVDNQGSGSAASEESNSNLGDYSVIIDSCRLATDYEGKNVVIVKYIFSNVSGDNATSFMVAFDDNVYQNGVGLNNAYVLNDSANYSEDNQMKEIKAGASLDVEVAYELNDTTTDIEVEVKELFSFDDDTVTKTFSITQ